ncbi:alpha/beta hydrolase, partial [Meiothermus taiwanensis]
MHIHEGYFSSTFVTGLFYRCWRPDTPKAIVIVIHGFGEHSGRYDGLATHLVHRGFAVYAPDLRGYGRSPGQRGHIDSWRDYWYDLSMFRNFVAGRERQMPMFVYGHSMGSLVVLDYLTYQIAGLQGAILSGVLLEPGKVANPLLIAAAQLLSRYLPTFSLRLGLDVRALSRDPEVVEAYRKDPLVHNRASARWGTEVLKTIAAVKAQVKNIGDPLLILHGEADRINRVEGAHWLFREVSSTDKELRIYPEGYHEPHNDLQKAGFYHNPRISFSRALGLAENFLTERNTGHFLRCK